MSMTVNNDVNAYAASAARDTNPVAKSADTKAEAAASDVAKDAGAVYEKSEKAKRDSANTLYNRDVIINKLKVDQQTRLASMQSLVENLLNKQKGTFDLANSTNLAATFREAAALASPEDIAKAKQDISEDGYWGVTQTSDRLVSMAIALAGGDTSKADIMIEAIQKGFKKATAAWGEELPQICQDTLDATMQKMDDWKNGVTTAEDYSTYLS